MGMPNNAAAALFPALLWLLISKQRIVCYSHGLFMEYILMVGMPGFFITSSSSGVGTSYIDY